MAALPQVGVETIRTPANHLLAIDRRRADSCRN